MIATNKIPENFADWKHCLINKCDIPLTQKFARQRLMVYRQAEHPETKEFIKLYGLEHYKRVVCWFEIIEKEESK